MRVLRVKIAPKSYELALPFIKLVATVQSVNFGDVWVEVSAVSSTLPGGPPIPCTGMFFPNALDDGMGSCILFRMVPDMPDADKADAVEEVTPEVREMLAKLLSKGG